MLRFFSSVFSFCKIKKVSVSENVSFADYMSGIRLPDCSKLAINWENFIIYRHDITLNFFYVALFLLSSLVTSPSFMLISSLVLELRQFIFIRE